MLQHDEGSNCGNLGSTGGKGRYLMFPQATDEVRENNDKLSPCSIRHISSILQLKKDECFVGEKQKEPCMFRPNVHTVWISVEIITNVLTFRGCGCLCLRVYLCVHGFSFFASQRSAHLWEPDCGGRWGVWYWSQWYRPLLLQCQTACSSPVSPQTREGLQVPNTTRVTITTLM